MPSWDQLMALLDKVGICGVTFILLVLHMYQEERHRGPLSRRKKGEEW